MCLVVSLVLLNNLSSEAFRGRQKEHDKRFIVNLVFYVTVTI